MLSLGLNIPRWELPSMEEWVRAAHKDGFRDSIILQYGSQNLNFQQEMSSLLTCNEEVVEFCFCNDEFL